MKKKIIILIVILLILAVGGCAAYAVLFTDLFKSDKEMFLTYLSKNISSLEVLSDNDLGKYMEEQAETPYESEGKLYLKSSDIDSDNFSLSFKGAVDNKSNYNYQKVKLNYTDSVSAEIDYLKDDNYIGIKIPEVIKKYLTIDTNQLQKLAKNIGIKDVDEIPDKIDLNTNIKLDYNTTNFTLKESYKEILLNSIQDENITKSKTDIYTKYSYKLTIADLKEIANKILVAVKNDEESLKEIAGENIEDIKENLQTIIDSLDKETDFDENVIEISVYVQGKELMKTEITSEENVITFQFSNDSIEIRGEEKDEEQLISVFDINIKKSKVADDLLYDIELTAKDESIKAKINFSGITSNEGINEKYSISTDDQISINYETTKKFVESIDKKEVTDKERYIINNKSMEKLSNMAQQLIMSVYQLHMNKLQEAGVLEDPITSLIEGSSRLENDEDDEDNQDENSQENEENQENNLEDASRAEDDDEN